MSFGSSSAASYSPTASQVSTQNNAVLQAAASPAAQPVIAPPPIPLPPPSAHSPVLGSALTGASSITPTSGTPGVFNLEGNIATSPQGIPTAPNTSKASLLGK